MTRESPPLITPVCVLELANIGGSRLHIFDKWEREHAMD